MKKFFRVFYSQIFNSFFPIIIIAILLKQSNNNNTASIFLLLNYANIYLLFSDYSSNTVFLKDALQIGGISSVGISEKIILYIYNYIGIKIIILSVGFFLWVALCFLSPLLHQHIFSNIFAYIFIIGYNMNFYWLYMSSNKEYFFIISNFLSRLLFLVLLIFFIKYHFSFSYLMPLCGLGTLAISVLIFKRFCRIYNLHINFTLQHLKQSIQILKRDWPLVANSFLIMSPSTSLSIFIGFVKNSKYVIVYAFAEKIYMAIRALLGVFVNSAYPLICEEGSINTKKSNRLFLFFYVVTFCGAISVYTMAPIIFSFLKLDSSLNQIFYNCLIYFLLVVFVISINTRFFLNVLVRNQFNNHKNFVFLLVVMLLITGLFILNTMYFNTVISIIQTLLIAESLIVVSLFAISRSKKNMV